MSPYIKITLAMCTALSCNASFGLVFPISNNSDIVGDVQYTVVKKGDTVYKIARKFDLGQQEIIEANPKVNPHKLKVGQKLKIPSSFILPPGKREGIVLNLAELRLYSFSEDGKSVSTHPVGIGRLGWKTPVGSTTIIRKREHPTWTPPASIRASYKKKHGKDLPAVVKAGPNNPLGDYAMNLGWPSYLIHGTDKPQSVGLRSSSGCVRMYPEDIKSLFNKTKKGTPVRVIHAPYKIGKIDSNLYLEAHEPFPEKYYGGDDDDDEIKQSIKSYYNLIKNSVNWNATNSELKQTMGYPIKITIN